MKRHVALVGFMASGKSTIGRQLARRLGCPFADTDAMIVAAHGAVPTIFAREGEAAFRQYEQLALRAALGRVSRTVVALGGGALTVDANRRILAENAHSVFLRVSPERVLARVRRSRDRRPLLGDAPTLEKIVELYERRRHLYEGADHTVDAERLNDRELIDEIVEWLDRIGGRPNAP